MTVDEQEVIEAIQNLLQQGIKPSAISIRELLQRGSLTTIQKHLKNWREGQSGTSTQTDPAPEVAIEASKKFAQQIWSLSLYQARQEAGIKTKELENELTDLRQEAQTAWSEVERLEKDVSSADEEKHKLVGQISEKEQQITELQMKCSEHEKEKKSQIMQISELQAQAAVVQSNIDEMKKESLIKQHELVSKNEQLEKSKIDNNQLILENHKLQAELKFSETHALKLDQERQSRIKYLEERNDQLSSELAEHKHKVTILEETMKHTESELHASQSREEASLGLLKKEMLDLGGRLSRMELVDDAKAPELET